jgi:hypothetical protein
MKISERIQAGMLFIVFSMSVTAAIDSPQSIMNLKVTSDGIYRVNASDIFSLGVDITGIDNSQISLLNKGRTVPVRVISNDNLYFDANSYIEFIGVSDDSLYQQGNVYSLVIKKNLAIKNSSLQPQTNLVTENTYMQVDNYAENNAYSFGSPINDPWYSQRVLAQGSEKTAILNFDINNLESGGDVTIEVGLWGGTDFPQSPDHHVKYLLNNKKVADYSFDGIKYNKHQFIAPSFKFTSGNQQLKVVVPNDNNVAADVVHIESWQVKYPRSFVLNNKQLDFLLNENIQTARADEIFSSNFEFDSSLNQGNESKASLLNTYKNYKVINANNEKYIIYELKQNGDVDFVNYIQSANCGINVSSDCSLEFSVRETSIHVYIIAESLVKKPELNLPILLEDIKSGYAEYLIITHPDFIGPELDTFVATKQQNFNVKVVNVEQIYAQFNHGNVSAYSIADYIQYTALHMGVKNVLLVGGDTYDYKNYTGSGSISFIPTLYGATDDLISYAPIDAKFADIDNDNIPDINIGRFPVRTTTEFANLIAKLDAYNNKTYNNTVVFAADGFDSNNGHSFKQDAELLIGVLPVEWQNNMTVDNKAYIDDDGVSLSKLKINNNINQGVALTSFIGHSGPTDWSFTRMFSASDANLLTNINSPTLVTQWGCWNTYFVSPTEDTLAHAFLLNSNGGAASVLGASTLTKAEHEKDLAQLVLRFLTQDKMTLGDAVTLAKRIYAQSNPDALDVILGWNILGDPSLKL